jgi:hypothetical protein
MRPSASASAARSAPGWGRGRPVPPDVRTSDGCMQHFAEQRVRQRVIACVVALEERADGTRGRAAISMRFLIPRLLADGAYCRFPVRFDPGIPSRIKIKSAQRNRCQPPSENSRPSFGMSLGSRTRRQRTSPRVAGRQRNRLGMSRKRSRNDALISAAYSNFFKSVLSHP